MAFMNKNCIFVIFLDLPKWLVHCHATFFKTFSSFFFFSEYPLEVYIDFSNCAPILKVKQMSLYNKIKNWLY